MGLPFGKSFVSPPPMSARIDPPESQARPTDPACHDLVAGASHGESATGLSGLRGRDSWNLADLPPLARGSLYLAVVMSLGGPSCLVTSTTDFVAPPVVRSAPFIKADSPDPNFV